MILSRRTVLPVLWLACVLGPALPASDSVTTRTETALRGDVFVLTPEGLVFRRETGAWLELPRREVQSFALDLGTRGRWARLAAQDGIAAFQVLAQENGTVRGRNALGQESAYALDDLRELALYPVTRPARLLPVSWVKQKPDFCGEACLEMVTSFLGESVTQDKVNEHAGLAGRRGVYGSELVAVVDRTLKLKTAGRDGRGCRTALDAFRDRLLLLQALEASRPVLLGVWADPAHKHNEEQWAFDHFVLLVGYDLRKGAFLIHDPGRGASQEWTFTDFTKHRTNRFGGLFQMEFLPVRNWTVGGKKLRAELLAAEKDSVTLKPEIGETQKVAAKDLGEEDRRFLEALTATADPRR
jgi:hypothetical protein